GRGGPHLITGETGRDRFDLIAYVTRFPTPHRATCPVRRFAFARRVAPVRGTTVPPGPCNSEHTKDAATRPHQLSGRFQTPVSVTGGPMMTAQVDREGGHSSCFVAREGI